MVKNKFRKLYIAIALLAAALVALIAVCAGLNAKYAQNKTVTDSLDVSVAAGGKKYILKSGREFRNEIQGRTFGGDTGIEAKSISFCRSLELLPEGAQRTETYLNIPASAKIELYIANRDDSTHTADFYVTATEGAGIIYANPDASSMFATLTKLETINFTGCNFTLTEKMNDMFNTCDSLKSVDFKFLKAPLLKDTGTMFLNCKNLVSVDMGNIDFANTTYMRSMFSGCVALTDVKFKKMNANSVTSTSDMFYDCGSLKTLDLSGLGSAKLDARSDMFTGCRSLESVTFGKDYVSPATDGEGNGCLPANGTGQWYAASNNAAYAPNAIPTAADTYYTSLPAVLNRTAIRNKITGSDTGYVNLVFGSFDTHARYLDDSNATWDSSTIEMGSASADGSDATTTNTVKVFPGQKYINGTNVPVAFILAEGSRKVVLPTDCSSLFATNSLLQTVTFDDVDASQVTTMYRMFYHCTKLTTVNLGDMDASKVTTMESMFAGDGNLTTVRFGTVNATSLKTTESMFYSCSKLTKVDLIDFSTSTALRNIKEMFMYCRVLKSLDLSGFNTTRLLNGAYASNMFQQCWYLEKLTVGPDFKFFVNPEDPSQSYISGADGYWHALSTGEKYNSSSTFPQKADTYYAYPVGMLSGSWKNQLASQNSVTSITVGNYNDYDDAVGKTWEEGTSVGRTYGTDPVDTTKDNVKLFVSDDGTRVYLLAPEGGRVVFPENSENLFANFKSLTMLTLSRTVNGLLTAPDTHLVKNMSHMFYNNPELNKLHLTGFDTSRVEDMSDMFRGTSSLGTDMSKLNELALGDGFDTSRVTNMSYMFWLTGLKRIDLKKFDTSSVTNMSCMFYKASNLTSLDLGSFDTSNVTNMNNMFDYNISLTSLNVGSFDTSNVTDMHSMFSECSALSELDVSGFDTSSVTNMDAMFNRCMKLTKIYGLENFDTSNVKNMQNMFDHCAELTSLDVSGFDTSNATNMAAMFARLPKISELDLSDFDTSNVTTMKWMFCNTLTNSEGILKYVDLTGFDTSNVTDMAMMFEGSSFTSLDLTGFDTSKVTNMSQMFYKLPALKKLDLRYFDMSAVTAASEMFTGSTLEEVTLGERFRFVDNTSYLPENGSDKLWYLGETGYAPSAIDPSLRPGTYTIKAA